MPKLKFLERVEFDDCRGFVSQHYNSLFKKQFHLEGLKLWHNEVDFYEYNELSGFYNGFNMFNGFGIKLNVMETIINSFCSKNLLKLSLNIITPND
jgi:hypothetical protein